MRRLSELEELSDQLTKLSEADLDFLRTELQGSINERLKSFFVDVYVDIMREEAKKTMRQTKEVIFFGSPACKQQMMEIRTKLELAFDILSGLQQPDHPESEDAVEASKKHYSYMELCLKAITNDILVALGAR